MNSQVWIVISEAMSKIGKKPIIIPGGVNIKVDGRDMEFKSGEKTTTFKVLPFINAEIKEGNLLFSPMNNSKQAKANWGTIRSLSQNAIIGITKGFEKNLEIEGVGYRAALEGNTLILNLGFSHPIKFNPPSGIKIAVLKNTITISGIDKDLVGKIASKIRAMKKVEPYKGKGIRYKGEVVRRKAGKKVAGAGK